METGVPTICDGQMWLLTLASSTSMLIGGIVYFLFG